MSYALVRADATHLPLADASVDLIVTSPPYFALRSYQDDGEHYDGQIGSEPTPADFLTALWAVMDECHRVLKPTGSAWINLGDKYAGSGGHNNSGVSGGLSQLQGASQRLVPVTKATRRSAPDHYNQSTDVPAKSLMGLPWRFALGLTCPDVYRPGSGPQWTLRAEVIWSKPNGLPESVTDRVRRSHEQWFHLTKQGRYYAAVDEVREVRTGNSHGGGKSTTGRTDGVSRDRGYQSEVLNFNPLGKLPGSVWTIPSEPLKVPDHIGVDHFAAFPQEWVRRITLGWSPSGICTACGEGRRPVVEKGLRVDHVQARTRGLMDLTDDGSGRSASSSFGITDRAIVGSTEATITGYACACDVTLAPTRPAVVLDPFVGTGTVPMVARALGRYGIGVDLSKDYLRLARWRISESRHGAKSEHRTNRERQGELW